MARFLLEIKSLLFIIMTLGSKSYQMQVEKFVLLILFTPRLGQCSQLFFQPSLPPSSEAIIIFDINSGI